MFKFPFSFREDAQNQTTGLLELDEPLSYRQNNKESGFYRPGKISLSTGQTIDLALYHNADTEKFIYLRDCGIESNLLDIIGVDAHEFAHLKSMKLPGQLCLGAARGKLIGSAIQTIFQAPVLESTFEKYRQENIAVYPIAREGLKYQVQDAIYENHGYLCDEIVLDAHHVFDSSVPVYNRTVELTLFKDKDLDLQQKENIAVAFFADSIASGLVMKEVVSRVKERFENLKQVEVISPLATIRGLCSLAKSDLPSDIRVRVHVFETLLNALPPDYYYSAHFNIPEFHFRPEAEQEYRNWWGKDANENFIADTACAGYGWSEAFYSPRKQIQMMNSQLQLRHNLTIAEIVRRNHGK
jgi:hypothetical protein